MQTEPADPKEIHDTDLKQPRDNSTLQGGQGKLTGVEAQRLYFDLKAAMLCAVLEVVVDKCLNGG